MAKRFLIYAAVSLAVHFAVQRIQPLRSLVFTDRFPNY